MTRLLGMALLAALVVSSPARAEDEDPGRDMLASGAVRVRVAVRPAEPVVVGQRVSLELALLTRTFFRGAPTLVDPDVAGAIVRKASDLAVNASDRIDGETYASQTWTWWIFPQRTGRFEVPAMDVVMRVADDDGKPVAVRTRTKPVPFEVVVPPEAKGRDVSFSAPSFEAAVRYDREPKDLRVGDAFERTVTMTIDGAPGMLVPPLPAVALDGVTVYAAPPEIEDESQRGTLTGRRVERTTFVMVREGRYELPEIRIPWWNDAKGSLEEAVVDAVPFEVVPNPDLDPEQLAALRGEAEGEDGPPTRHDPLATAGWVLLAVLLALFASWAWRRYGSALRARLAAARAARADTESAWFARLVAACRANDAPRAMQDLLTWLDRRAGPAALGSLEGFLADADDEALTREVHGLEDALYGAGRAAAWKGEALASNVTRVRDRLRDAAPADVAGPGAMRLNPRGEGAART